MHFDSGLKLEDHIYIIEHFSRCLISIHISSGEARIEANLPWKYVEIPIGMLPWEHSIVIYSPVVDHFLIYDYKKRQMKIVELEGIESDGTGFYYSNVVMNQSDFIVLPFKGKTIRRYGEKGKLKLADDKWCSSIECDGSERLTGNIRMNSACIVGEQLFFSLVHKNQNYLCKYGLNQDKRLCDIVYCSKDIAIKGVYSYSNKVVFRRIFPRKTEVLLMTLDSGDCKKILIDYPAMFEKDVYWDDNNFRISLKNSIMSIRENDFDVYQKIYDFERSDNYVANGILFNVLKNEILMPNKNYVNKYSIGKIVKKIQNYSSYQEGYRKFFSDKCIMEVRQELYDLLNFISQYLRTEKKTVKIVDIGEQIWKEVR